MPISHADETHKPEEPLPNLPLPPVLNQLCKPLHWIPLTDIFSAIAHL